MTSDIESAKGDNSNQAIVYIDGFNFYRRIVDKTPYKWLDLELMCSQLLKGYKISKIKYFTARVHPTPHNRQQDIRQNTYFRALGTNPKIEIYLGQFVSSERRFPVHPWAYDKDGCHDRCEWKVLETIVLVKQKAPLSRGLRTQPSK